MSFTAELHAWRDRLDGDYVSAEEAQKFVEWMRDEHADALDEWMIATAIVHTTRAFARVEQDLRRYAIRSAFASAAEDRDETALSLFAIRFVVDGNQTRREFAEMTGRDCGYAAGRYEQEARRELLLAEFLRAAERKAGAKKLSDVMSEVRWEALLRSILGDAAKLELVA